MRFAYTIKDANGKTITGSDDALDQGSLALRLQNQGYFVVSIQPFSLLLGKKTKKKSRTFSHSGVQLDDLLVLSRQLATMLDAGVPLLRSLDVICTQVESRQLMETLNRVRKDVEQGISLSTSLAKHPKVFNQFWVSLIEVGEASGTMPTVLNKLAFYLEQQAAFQSAMVSAIIYPFILFIVSIVAVLFFALAIGPRFQSLFESFNITLPLITRILLESFDFIKTKFVLFAGIIGAILILVGRFARTPFGKLQIEKFLFSLPKLGYVYKTIIVERFTSQMSILVDTGVPILYALDITQRMMGNRTCEEIIAEVKNSVREGKLIAEEMGRSNFFPPMAVQMIMIGEETGELGKMLKRVADYYQEYVQVFMKRFGTIFEPFMLVFMGVVIGVIVVAMFLPIFNISQIGVGN